MTDAKPSPKLDRVRRRQDPVSCRLCRVKKLKCNRLNPCSNCTARGQPCEYEQSQAAIDRRIQHDAEPSNAVLLSRLQRLEDMIIRMSPRLPNTPDGTSPTRSDFNVLGNTSVLTRNEVGHEIESCQVTRIGPAEPSVLPSLSSQFVFDAVPLQSILKHESSTLGARPVCHGQKLIILPTYDDAQQLFDLYAKYVCHFHRIVHMGTVRRMLDNFYSKLSRREEVDTNQAALILSICAIVLCYTNWTEDEPATKGKCKNGADPFLLFFRSALDLLDHARRILPASLEIVQTCIITMFLDCRTEGFTTRARAIHAQGLHSAKELGMHRLDSPSAMRKREVSQTVEAIIDLEIKRRIWWHLVATDWLISLTNSVQEGIYTAHPSHMRVRLPRNINDDMLESGDATTDLPLNEPSTMSHSLQRIRLGEICRSMVDTMRFGLTDDHQYDYGNVMMLDKRIQKFLEDLPVFLKLDPESLQKSQHILDQFPSFIVQRYIINVGAHTIRSKLHQPFLVRGTDKVQYAESAEICLSSAMRVIEIYKIVRNDPKLYASKEIRLTGILHHTFLATIVLVMDLCFNKEGGSEHSKSIDLKQAIDMLEDSKEQSTSCQRFLDSLMDALKKYRVCLIDEPGTVGEPLRPTQPVPGAQLWQPGLDAQSPGTSMQMTLNGEAILPGLSWPMQTGLEQNEAAYMLDWDQLFSELDTFIA